MVFSSIPVYLDPPNWHQQPNHHPLGSVTTQNHSSQLPPLPPPRQFSTTTHVGGGVGATVVDSSGSGGSGGTAAGSIRPNSMADQARMSKMPQPETALKCPRCESTNTKFCYFNNYSLSQPRHFCKTCRRYWTRGGALRNVPVGGGCRRNKKSKTNSRSKSPASAAGSTGQTAAATDLISPPQTTSTPSIPFLESIQNLSRYSGTTGNMGFNDIQQAQDQMGFQIGTNNLMMNLSSNSGGLGLQDQWRSSLQHIPFLGSNNGFELSSATGLYPFQNTTSQGGIDQETTTNSRVTTTSPVKVEDHNNNHNHGGVSLTRPFLGISAANNNNNNNSNNQFWGGNNAWTDLSGTLNSSSTSHLL